MLPIIKYWLPRFNRAGIFSNRLPRQNEKAARMSGLFNIFRMPGQAVFAGLAAAAFLALIATFLRLM